MGVRLGRGVDWSAIKAVSSLGHMVVESRLHTLDNSHHQDDGLHVLLATRKTKSEFNPNKMVEKGNDPFLSGKPDFQVRKR